MVRWLHEDLIDVARELAQLDRGRGPPRQATLRRAISTAYYAVFHAIAFHCANQLVGKSKSWEYFTPVYRALEHGKTKLVLEALGKQHEAFASIAQIFIELQRARELADYDPEYRMGRVAVLDLIERARTARDSLQSLSENDKLRLATQLVRQLRKAK